MKTKVVQIDKTNPDVKVIKQAAKIVNSGGIVAFPTETVYGLACKVMPSAIEKLNNVKNRPSGKRYTLMIDGPDRLGDYVPEIPARAEKLTQAVWPGPLTAVFELDKSQLDRVEDNFDKFTFGELYHSGSIGIRSPQGLIPQQLLKCINAPVVVPSANISDLPPAVNPKEVLAQLDGKIDMLLDAGSCQHKKPSTVVKFTSGKIEILRPGALSLEDIARNSTINILFVCTGNTCRSPMAEGLCKKYLAKKISCDLDQLESFGYKVGSAGVAAVLGMPVTPEAVEACRKYELDISSHSALPLTRELLLESDFIFTMTSQHKSVIEGCFSGYSGELSTLGSVDVVDPICAGLDVYLSCANMIDKMVKLKIDSILHS